MSKKVIYGNGYVGTVSDKVADILVKKGEVKLVDEPKKEPKPEAKK